MKKTQKVLETLARESIELDYRSRLNNFLNSNYEYKAMTPEAYQKVTAFLIAFDLYEKAEKRTKRLISNWM